MASIEQQAKGKKDGEIRYLTPLNIETNTRKKYCRFKKSGIKYIDYKDADFSMKLVNEQGKLLPRRLTGTSLKYQRKVAQAVKRAIDLAAALEKEGQEIDRKYISINGGSVKRTGPYNAQIRLHREVILDFPFEVVAEKK